MSPNQKEQPDSVQPSLNLACTVDNNGTFIWSWAGPAVNKAVTKLTDTTRTSILTIPNVSSFDVGNYTCTASYFGFNDVQGFNRIPLMTTFNNITLILNGEFLLYITCIIPLLLLNPIIIPLLSAIFACSHCSEMFVAATRQTAN